MLESQSITFKKIMAMTVVLYLVMKVVLERVVHKSIAPRYIPPKYKNDANKQ